MLSASGYHVLDNDKFKIKRIERVGDCYEKSQGSKSRQS